MAKLRCFCLAAFVLAVAGVVNALTIQFEDRRVDVPTTVGDRLEILPVARLVGAEAAYSPAAGTWVVKLDERLIQLAAGSRHVLIDSALKELDEAPVESVGGLAASPSFIDEALLEPLGFHFENRGDGLVILRGGRYLPPVTISPVVADFRTTTTLVLALDRDVPVKVEEGPRRISVRFEDGSPRLDRSRRVESRRIVRLEVQEQSLRITTAEGIGLLSWHRLEDPPRLSFDLGQRRDEPRRTETAPPPPAPRDGSARPVVIDPGHGGGDVGAVSEAGLEEKDVVLSIGRELARLLERRGVPTRLTRDEDSGRALTDRTSLANRLEARAFLSLHANASPVRSVRGAETYYISLDDDISEDAAATARLENRGAEVGSGGSDLELILWDMAQAEVLNESARLALAVQKRLNGLEEVPDRGVKQAPFVVLTGATMPAILVEVGFLTNPAEGRRLATREYRRRLAEAIAAGVLDFLDRQ